MPSRPQDSDVEGRDLPAEAAATPRQRRDTLAKSYRYLRLAMVGLLLCLSVAVLIESGRQEWNFLGSVSAYYYTPAQAMFVGGLVGLGSCMIALQGTTTLQDVSLNLGGVFAVIVAIVPTGRDDDYRTVVRICREGGTPPSGSLDCPTVQALEEATKANVDNNLWALLLVGAAALIFALALARKDGTLKGLADENAKRKFWWGFGAALVLELAVLVARLVSLQWVVDNGHWIAAVLLFVSIFLVGLVNSWRFKREQSGDVPALTGSGVTRSLDAIGQTVRDLIAVGRRRDRYIVMARLMLLVGAVSAVLWSMQVITLFAVEGAIFVLFMVFWTVQTFELERPTRRGTSDTNRQAPPALG